MPTHATSPATTHPTIVRLSDNTLCRLGPSKTKVGNYPLVNVYANFRLKHARFFVMMSHVNAGSGNRSYFFAPFHYPLNQRVLRFGVSRTFFN